MKAAIKAATSRPLSPVGRTFKIISGYASSGSAKSASEASEMGSRMIEPNPMTIQGQVRMTIAATANQSDALTACFSFFAENNLWTINPSPWACPSQRINIKQVNPIISSRVICPRLGNISVIPGGASVLRLNFNASPEGPPTAVMIKIAMSMVLRIPTVK